MRSGTTPLEASRKNIAKIDDGGHSNHKLHVFQMCTIATELAVSADD